MDTRFRYAKELEAEISEAERGASPQPPREVGTQSEPGEGHPTLNSFHDNTLFYPYRMIDKSMAGTDVAVLQAVLSARGYYAGALDGVFGDLLDTAVRKFQMDHDLVVDGVCGPMTWRKILEME